jgi:hypothetical protein
MRRRLTVSDKVLLEALSKLEAKAGEIESSLSTRRHYRKLKQAKNLVHKKGALTKQIKMAKIASQPEAEVHPRALEQFNAEEIAEINQLRANNSVQELEAKINNLNNDLEQVKQKYSEQKTKIDVMDIAITLEPARKELTESLGSERDATEIITTYAALWVAGIPKKGPAYKGYGKYAKSFSIDPKSNTSGHSDQEVTNDIIEAMRNPQEAVKYPELIRVWVNHVLDSEEFHTTYTLEVANANYGIVSQAVVIKEGDLPSYGGKADLSKLPWQDDLVGKDGNWVTYLAEPYMNARKIKNFYKEAEHTKNDPYMAKVSGIRPSWCVLGDSNQNLHGSYKNNDADAKWYVTFSLNNPVIEAAKWMEEKGHLNNGVTKDQFLARVLEQNLSNAISSMTSVSSEGEYGILNRFMGEIYMVTEDKRNSNGGRHTWDNRGNGKKAEQLIPHYTNTYENLEIKSSMSFEVAAGTLVKYSGDDAKVSVPYGVTTIGPKAFADNEKIVEVRLLSSVTRIESKAFENCKNLRGVRVTHNLHEVSRTAFDGIDHSVYLGVVEVVDGKQRLVKPRSIDWMPTSINQYKKPEAQPDPEVAEEVEELIGESKFDGRHRKSYLALKESIMTIGEGSVDLKGIQYKSKRRLYLDGPTHPEYGVMYFVENGALYFNESLDGQTVDMEIQLPEGVTGVATKVYGNYPSFIFPRSFRSFNPNVVAEYGHIFDYQKIGYLDLYDTAVDMIEPKVFGTVFCKTLRLPKNLRVLGGTRADGGALAYIRLNTLYFNVSSLVELDTLVGSGEHRNTFEGFKKPFLQEIYTDDVTLFEILRGGYTSIDQIPAGSKAMELVNQFRAELEDEASPLSLSDLTNVYLNDNRFKARIINKKAV